MAQFQQIVVNFLVGTIIFWMSAGVFGLAVRFGFNIHLAPRTWSRPRAVIKNVLKNAFFVRWYIWGLGLSYPELLDGIPGTGTRKDGWAGPKLKTNLDGVIMMKFHTLLWKVSLLATLLCMLVAFPVNFTAVCDPEILGWGTCLPINNLTTFDQSTIAHVPPFEFNPVNVTPELAAVSGEPPRGFSVREANLAPRYMAIVAVALVVYIYTCVLLRREWIENVALRRVYYLEHDHYEERLDELEASVSLNDPEDPFQDVRPPWLPHPELRETVPNVSLYSALYKLPSQFITSGLHAGASDLERQLAATVEFFDECVPNQPGYSSSVAAVTILPEASYVTLAWGKWYLVAKRLRKLRYIRSILQAKMERDQAQEEIVVEEKAVEGITSDAKPTDAIGCLDPIAEDDKNPKELTSQEQESQPNEKNQNGNVERKEADFGNSSPSKPASKENPGEGTDTNPVESDGDKIEEDSSNYVEPSAAVSPGGSMTVELELKAHSAGAIASIGANDNATEDDDDQKFLYSDFDTVEYARLVGMVKNGEIEDHFNGLGIEQLSAYAREFAQNSSNACPFGLAHNTIKFASIPRLMQMEKVAQEKLEEAYQELAEARATVLEKVCGMPVGDDSDGDDETKLPEPDLEEAAPAVLGKKQSGLRKRITNSTKWKAAERMARSIGAQRGARNVANSMVSSTRSYVTKRTVDVEKLKEQTQKVINFLDHPTYAVVTFTSRQAAIAARQCLTDGGGLDRWTKIDELPVTPLADAPPYDIIHCRGICRPVTLTISDSEKTCRTISANTFFVIFSLLYTIPLWLTSHLLDPATLAEWFPEVEAFQDPDNFFFKFLSGISSGFVYTIFFMFCPQLFKAIALFKGNASSMAVAEDNALQYYWIFMLLTAFTGSSFASMFFSIIQGVNAGTALKDVFREIALAIPTQQGPVWLNWIVVRFTYTLPFLYLFQFNTFGFAIIRWPWMNRVMRGGGPGGPPPYRIYIDGGTVFLCAVGLGPVCPTITVFAFIYFCVMNPLLRWLLIFVYRPKYDGGGNKWPKLHDIIVSTLVVSQFLLSLVLFLKFAYWAAGFVFLLMAPTLVFGSTLKRNFLRQYRDAGLLQTSRLDGWDTERATSRTKREEYRRWLVDCHKASYVPVCLATGDSILTAEPCAVIPTHRDIEQKDRNGVLRRQTAQRGALFRREISRKGFSDATMQSEV